MDIRAEAHGSSDPQSRRCPKDPHPHLHQTDVAQHDASQGRSGRRLATRAVVFAGLLAAALTVVGSGDAQAAVQSGVHEMVPLAVNDLPTIVSNLRNWVMGILAALATLFLTIGGVRYLMAGGDPSEVERAKAAFRSAAVGYVLAVIAPVVLTVLRSIIGS
jgi:hypothetical protein